MAESYLTLTNKVIARLNEVELTSSNFGNSRGIQTQCKHAINEAIRYVNQKEFNYPFNNTTATKTLTTGTVRYSLPSSTKTLDYNTFRLKKDNDLATSGGRLSILDYNEYINSFITQEDDITTNNLWKFVALSRYQVEYVKGGDKKIAILTNGYMLGRAYDVWLKLIEQGIEVSIYDVWKLKPLNQELLKLNIDEYNYIVTIEEQTLDGGFGSIISEFICDNQLSHKLLRIGLPETFIFENGSRDHLLDTHNLSVDNIYKNIRGFIQ